MGVDPRTGGETDLVRLDPAVVSLDPDETNYVSSVLVQHSAAGRAFVGSTDALSTGVGTENIRATIANPAGSGVNILLGRLAATSDGIGGLVIGDVYINPDTGLPATEWTPFCTAVGAAVAQGVFRADAGSELSGGTATELHIPLTGSGRVEFDLDAPIIIAPGVTLGLNLPLGALSSTDGAFAAYWLEVPA